MELGISGGIGLLFGALVAWLALRSRSATLQARLSLTEKELSGEKAELARLLADQRELVEARARLESTLESERKTSTEKVELMTKTSERAAEDLQNAFKALAGEALRSNNQSFLQIAQETLKRFQSEAKGDLDARHKAVADLVAPVRESLTKVDAQIQQMEKERMDAYGGLRQQVESLVTTQEKLQSETGNLVKAAAHAECTRALGEGNYSAAAGGGDCRRTTLVICTISVSRKRSRERADACGPIW